MSENLSEMSILGNNFLGKELSRKRVFSDFFFSGRKFSEKKYYVPLYIIGM